MYFIALYNLQSIGVSKSSQKSVALVQLQMPVNTAGSVGALIAVWYSLLLKNMFDAGTFLVYQQTTCMLVLFRSTQKSTESQWSNSEPCKDGWWSSQ